MVHSKGKLDVPSSPYMNRQRGIDQVVGRRNMVYISRLMETGHWEQGTSRNGLTCREQFFVLRK